MQHEFQKNASNSWFLIYIDKFRDKNEQRRAVYIHSSDLQLKFVDDNAFEGNVYPRARSKRSYLDTEFKHFETKTLPRYSKCVSPQNVRQFSGGGWAIVLSVRTRS